MLIPNSQSIPPFWLPQSPLGNHSLFSMSLFLANKVSWWFQKSSLMVRAVTVFGSSWSRSWKKNSSTTNLFSTHVEEWAINQGKERNNKRHISNQLSLRATGIRASLGTLRYNRDSILSMSRIHKFFRVIPNKEYSFTNTTSDIGWGVLPEELSLNTSGLSYMGAKCALVTMQSHKCFS